VKLPERYLTVHNVGLLQRQAGVDPAVAELVQAFARLRVDANRAVTFEFESFPRVSVEEGLLRRLARSNPRADERFLRFMAAYGADFKRRGLPIVFHAGHLAGHLSIPGAFLRRLAANPVPFYREIRIPKKHGGERVLHAPEGALRQVQYWILRRLLDHDTPHAAAHAFRRGRSIVTNARLHEGQRVVIRIDLENFFPSVRQASARRVFQRLGYPYSVASLLAALCSLQGGLPQGAPTSPALSNLVNMRLDARFTALGTRLGFRYSRYADDLVFSSTDDRLPALLPFFKEVIVSEGYVVNEKKTRVMRRGAPQVVTGLVTNVHTTLPRARRRELRAMLHRLRTKGAGALEIPGAAAARGGSLAVLRGHLAFARMIERQRGKDDA
jgi:RNA-directed DNA polymerase